MCRAEEKVDSHTTYTYAVELEEMGPDDHHVWRQGRFKEAKGRLFLVFLVFLVLLVLLSFCHSCHFLVVPTPCSVQHREHLPCSALPRRLALCPALFLPIALSCSSWVEPSLFLSLSRPRPFCFWVVRVASGEQQESTGQAPVALQGPLFPQFPLFLPLTSCPRKRGEREGERGARQRKEGKRERGK